MTIALASPEALAAEVDRWIPSTGEVGYLCLLSGVSQTLPVTSSGDIFTTTAHSWVTGTRVRISSTGRVPSPLLLNVDYFVITLSPTTFSLASTAAAAIAGTAISLADVGSGTITAIGQALSATDLMAVLVSREVSHPNYTRHLVSNVGAANPVGVAGEKPAFPVTLTIGAANPALTFRHFLFFRGGSATIGDASGTEPRLATESTDVTISPGATRYFTLTFRGRNG